MIEEVREGIKKSEHSRVLMIKELAQKAGETGMAGKWEQQDALRPALIASVFPDTPLRAVDSAQCEPALDDAAGAADSAAARLGVSAGHHVLRRLPARYRSMHSRISALKARSGVSSGQP